MTCSPEMTQTVSTIGEALVSWTRRDRPLDWTSDILLDTSPLFQQLISQWLDAAWFPPAESTMENKKKNTFFFIKSIEKRSVILANRVGTYNRWKKRNPKVNVASWSTVNKPNLDRFSACSTTHHINKIQKLPWKSRKMQNMAYAQRGTLHNGIVVRGTMITWRRIISIW